MPSGLHGTRTLVYVFGRYPSAGETYQVRDLVICHGDFLNTYADYVHKNKAVRGFGSYGDILIRDRKMYVVRTPYGLTTGTKDHFSLIVPDSWSAQIEHRYPEQLARVGELHRRLATSRVLGYEFNLWTNVLSTKSQELQLDDPVVRFVAYRPTEAPGFEVADADPKLEKAADEEAIGAAAHDGADDVDN